MLSALKRAAEALTGNEHPDPLALPWERLTYAHVQAARAKLAERYAPATANQSLAALRGVLKECWRLGLTDAARDRVDASVQRLRDTFELRG